MGWFFCDRDLRHERGKEKNLKAQQQHCLDQNTKKILDAQIKITNIYNRKTANENLSNYKKERNFDVNLFRKTKNEYFQNLNIRDLSDNKKVSKTIKPYFRNTESNLNIFFP